MLAELNGFAADGSPLSTFAQLGRRRLDLVRQLDPRGLLRGRGEPDRAAQAVAEQSWVAPEWGWAWPANRRILYNRASADPQGRPWSAAKAYVWWDEQAGEWTGHDVPDFEKNKPPGFVPEPGATGPAALGGADPFILQADGKAALFVPRGLVGRAAAGALRGGRVAVAQPGLQAGRQPGLDPVPDRRADPRPARPGTPPRSRIVVTTYRLTEHHTAGLDEPDAGPAGRAAARAVLRGLAGAGGRARAGERRLGHDRHAPGRRSRPGCWSPGRNRPLRIPGEGVIHQVGLPYHWGGEGLVTGDSVNDLLPFALDPNVFIQESKAATCDIRPGRRPRGRARIELVEQYRTGPAWMRAMTCRPTRTPRPGPAVSEGPGSIDE